MCVRTLRLSTTLAFLCLCVPALATPALTVTGDAGGVYNHGSYTLGWEFTIASPIQVNALGFWDYLGDGFAPGRTTVDVAIWNASQNQLTSAVVLSGDPLSNVLIADSSGFRFHNLSSPIVLQAGTYVIGGTNHGESYLFYPTTSVTYDPAITWVHRRFVGGDSPLAYPDTIDDSPGAGWFGPNFTFGPANGVPEPASMLLLVVGLLGIATARMRRAA